MTTASERIKHRTGCFYAVAYRNEGGKWLGLAKYPWNADPEKADGLRKWLKQNKPEFEYALATLNITENVNE